MHHRRKRGDRNDIAGRLDRLLLRFSLYLLSALIGRARVGVSEVAQVGEDIPSVFLEDRC
jgi:hypothetical protein